MRFKQVQRFICAKKNLGVRCTLSLSIWHCLRVIFTSLLYQTVVSVVLLAIPVLLVMLEGLTIGMDGVMGASEKPATYTLK